MERTQEENHVSVVVRRRRRRHIAHFTSEDLLSLCLSAYIIIRSTSLSLLEVPPILQKASAKSLSVFHSFDVMQPSFSCTPENFKSRPIKIRYRNDQFLLGFFTFESTFCAHPVVRPLLTQDHTYVWSQDPSSSYSDSASSSSSENVTTQGWDREVQLQKRKIFSFSENRCYDCGLTSLSEKNVHQSLSSSEVVAYQNSAKNFFAGFLTQTDPHRIPNDAQCVEEGNTQPVDSWVARSEFLDDKESSSISANSFGRASLHNITFLELDNPILNDVPLSQSAQFYQNNESFIRTSENVFLSQGNSPLRGRQDANDKDNDQAAGSLFSTFTVGDSQFDRCCANDQVKHDMTQSLLELNSTYENTGYFSDVAFASTSSNLSFSADQSYSSSPSSHSDRSSVSHSECSFGVENFPNLFAPEVAANSQASSRDYGKLFPKVNEAYLGPIHNTDRAYKEQCRKTEFGGKSEKVVRGRRGRRSKDEILVLKFKLPATAAAISEMSLSELQRLSRTLTEEQRVVMKKIRRRGKNKVAARMCRRRKTMASPPTVLCKKDNKRGFVMSKKI